MSDGRSQECLADIKGHLRGLKVGRARVYSKSQELWALMFFCQPLTWGGAPRVGVSRRGRARALPSHRLSSPPPGRARDSAGMPAPQGGALSVTPSHSRAPDGGPAPPQDTAQRGAPVITHCSPGAAGLSPSEWTGWISLQSRGLSRIFSNTTVQKHQFLGLGPRWGPRDYTLFICSQMLWNTLSPCALWPDGAL